MLCYYLRLLSVLITYSSDEKMLATSIPGKDMKKEVQVGREFRVFKFMNRFSFFVLSYKSTTQRWVSSSKNIEADRQLLHTKRRLPACIATERMTAPDNFLLSTMTHTFQCECDFHFGFFYAKVHILLQPNHMLITVSPLP